MIVLTVVTTPRPVRVGLRLLEGRIGWARGFPTCTFGTELPRFSSGSSKDRSGMGEHSFELFRYQTAQLAAENGNLIEPYFFFYDSRV